MATKLIVSRNRFGMVPFVLVSSQRLQVSFHHMLIPVSHLVPALLVVL